jgi:hypothetical protein
MALKLLRKKTKATGRKAMVNQNLGRVEPMAKKNRFSFYASSRYISRDSRLKLLVQKMLRNKVESMVVVIVLLVLVQSLFAGSTPRIQYVGVVPAGAYGRSADYLDVASQLIAEDTGNVFKPTYDGDQLATKMKIRFPEIETINSYVSLVGRRPEIVVKLTKPELYYQTPSGLYLSGSSTKLVVVPLKTLQLPTLVDESGVTSATLPLSAEQYSTLVGLSTRLEQLNIKVDKYVLPGRPYEVEIRIVGTSYYVKASLQGEGSEQAVALSEALKTIVPKNQPTQYIDIRAVDRVFLK